jgi:hypothetical protein
MQRKGRMFLHRPKLQPIFVPIAAPVLSPGDVSPVLTLGRASATFKTEFRRTRAFAVFAQGLKMNGFIVVRFAPGPGRQ